MHVGIRHMGMKPGTAQIFGYAAAGAISGGLSASQNAGNFKWGMPARPLVRLVLLELQPLSKRGNDGGIKGRYGWRGQGGHLSGLKEHLFL